MAGIRGPASFAAQTQTFIHRLLDDQRPMGWGNQLGSKFIMNISFIAEKQLTHFSNLAEVIAGGQAFAGTLLNSASAYVKLRIGKMNPYFDGYISQHRAIRSKAKKSKHRIQAYLILRPSVGITVDNNMLTQRAIDPQRDNASNTSLAHWNFNVDYGAEINAGHFGMSFIQKSISPMLKGLPRHEVGNISIYYSW